MFKPEDSPHTLQNSESKYVTETFSWSKRILDHENYPSNCEYTPNSNNENTTVVHYGRYQLLLCEIEFLTLALQDLSKDYCPSEIKNKKIVVVYGGAAIGSHLKILHDFFPFIKFILYDTQTFRLGTDIDESKFVVRKLYLNAKIAGELKNEYDDRENFIRLFISDIRRNNKEITVEQDMDLQAEIHKELQPYRSYLKFRLPYYNGNRLFKKYLDGVIYFLAFGNRSTSETRLYVRQDSDFKNYDCKKYENQMYFFNKYERTNCYKHEIDAPGLDHCYDCRSLVFILDEYRKIFETKIFLFPPSFDIGKRSTNELYALINNRLKSNSKKIEYTLNYEQEFFQCEYNFTNMQLGTKINREFLNRIKIKQRKNDFIFMENRFSKISLN